MANTATFQKFARKRSLRAGSIRLTLVGRVNLTNNASTKLVQLNTADEYTAVKNCLPAEAKLETFHGCGGYRIPASWLDAAKKSVAAVRKAVVTAARERAEKVRKDFAVLRGMCIALAEYGTARFKGLLARMGSKFFARLAMRWANGTEMYSVATAGYKPVTLGDMFGNVLNNLRTR